MTSIFVAKLDFGVTSEQLKEAFSQYGTVLKATVATDRETGKSRGFGFVEMEDAAEAKSAIAALDNFQFNGRPITVKEAEQREKRPAREPFSKPTPHRSGDSGSSNYKRPDSPISNSPTIDPDEFKKTISKTTPNFDKPKKEAKKKNSGMEAYKKSGKTPRYDLDIEDEDLIDWKSSSRSKQFDDDDDEEDEW